jgi:hypothetical protein
MFTYMNICLQRHIGGCRGHDRMVVGFTNSYAISAHHHSNCCDFESFSGEVNSDLYVIKFVTDLRQVCGFLQVFPFPPQYD